MTAPEVIDTLVRTNLAAAAAIVVVVGLRKPARTVSGARIAYCLWLLPALASAAVCLPARKILSTAVSEAASGPFDMALLTSAATPSAVDPSVLLVALWLLGVFIAGLILCRIQDRFSRAARAGFAGPAVVGLIKPVVVTPSDFLVRYNLAERMLILEHERTHIARQDHRLNGLCCAVQCLLWFNPLVHVAARLMRIDQELACDESVVERLPHARRTYAEVLLKAQLAMRPLPLGCNWPAASEHPLLERITMLKSKPLSRSRRFVGAGLMTVVFAGVSVATWAAQPASPQGGAPARPALTHGGAVAPVDIRADRASADHRRWTGKVSVVRGQDRLMSDELNIVYSAPSKMQRLIAQGHVLYVSDGGTARADRAVYEPAPHTLTFVGNVVAVRNQREVRAQKLVLNLAE